MPKATVPSAVDRFGHRAGNIGRAAAAERDAYANGEERPLGSYVLLLGAYASGVVALGAWVRRRGRPLPERPALADLALIAVATHRLTRVVARDSVTAAIRAPTTPDVGIGPDVGPRENETVSGGPQAGF